MAGLTSYAQNFEDVILWRALGHVRNGRYIDVGAQSPLVDSVSMGFYERGWRGIHVEPTAAYSNELRAARPDEWVIEAAVDAAVGELVFFEVPDTGLSTTRRDIAEQHASAGFGVVERVVPTTTLDEVLAAAQGQVIHWLKIDVEGSEGEVLRGWRKAEDRPWVLVVESTLPMTQMESHLEWEPLVLEKGYRFAYFDGLNRFYVAQGHDDLLPAFAIGPNVFDGFVLSGTASSPFCARVNSRLQALDHQINVEREEAARRLEVAHRDAEDRLHAVATQLQTYAERLQITQTDLHSLRDLHLAQISKFQAHVQWLEAEWGQTKAELGEVNASAHHWRAESDRLTADLQVVFDTTSWRVTAPLRQCKRMLSLAVRLPPRAIRWAIRVAKQVAGPVAAKLMRSVLANARIKSAALRWLDGHPRVKVRMRQFATGFGVIEAGPRAFSWEFAVPAIGATFDPNLSPCTARVLSDLAHAVAKERR